MKNLAYLLLLWKRISLTDYALNALSDSALDSEQRLKKKPLSLIFITYKFIFDCSKVFTASRGIYVFS